MWKFLSPLKKKRIKSRKSHLWQVQFNADNVITVSKTCEGEFSLTMNCISVNEKITKKTKNNKKLKLNVPWLPPTLIVKQLWIFPAGTQIAFLKIKLSNFWEIDRKKLGHDWPGNWLINLQTEIPKTNWLTDRLRIWHTDGPTDQQTNRLTVSVFVHFLNDNCLNLHSGLPEWLTYRLAV